MFTRMYMGFYDFIVGYLPLVLIGLGLIIFGVVSYVRTRKAMNNSADLSLKFHHRQNNIACVCRHVLPHLINAAFFGRSYPRGAQYPCRYEQE